MEIINKQIELNDYKENEITIDSTKDSELVILNNNNILNMTINLLDSSTLIINELQEDYQNNKIITINIYNNSTLIYNLSNITKNGSNTQIKINFKGENSRIETNIHSLVSGHEYIKIVGNIENDYQNNELLENVKVILTNNGTCEIVPDMLIDTNLVVANHKVAISYLRDNDLFYLMSKGISRKKSEELIKKSFLLSNLSNEKLKEKITKFD